MKVNVLYFAAARESAGTKAEELDLPAGATAADALAAACAAHPRLSAIAGKLRLAVDQQFAPGSLPLREGAEVALIPPVAGGAGDRRPGSRGRP
jgi:molybdopterin synthase catalytic subunit